MIHKKITVQKREYEVREFGEHGWMQLVCDGTEICKLINEEECRRMIWNYWTNQGIAMDYLTADDFDDVVQEIHIA